MSVSIVTGGLFHKCYTIGGGALPFREYADEVVKPLAIVKNFEMKDKRPLKEYKKIKVQLVDFD